MNLTTVVHDAAEAVGIPEQGLWLALAMIWPTLTKPSVRLGVTQFQAEEIRQKAGEISRSRRSA